MFDHFSKLLRENFKINESHRLLIAVSGGMDSVVLTHLCDRAKLDFALAHVNFQLRAEESDQDENFVKELAQKYDVPFYSMRAETCEKSVEWNMSIQMAARKIRYDFFEELLEEYNFDFVCTAHHANDSFETAILNFIKSSHYSGLSGIPSRNQSVIRPLFSYSREEIAEYAKINSLEWREDVSNESTKYLRNKVRHQLVPLVEEINPSFLDNFTQTSDQLNLLKFFIQKNLAAAMGDWILEKSDEVKINIDHLNKKPEDIILLWELLRDYGYNFSQLKFVVAALNSESGKSFESTDFILVKDRDYFILNRKTNVLKEVRIKENDSVVKLESGTLHLKMQNGDTKIEKDESVAILDADKLKFPLELRPWKEGDRFQPLGMNGEKKLSDFLIDLKVPLHEKRKQYVLLSGQNIVWVLGRRINHKFRVTAKTSHTLRIEMK